MRRPWRWRRADDPPLSKPEKEPELTPEETLSELQQRMEVEAVITGAEMDLRIANAYRLIERQKEETRLRRKLEELRDQLRLGALEVSMRIDEVGQWSPEHLERTRMRTTILLDATETLRDKYLRSSGADDPDHLLYAEQAAVLRAMLNRICEVERSR